MVHRRDQLDALRGEWAAAKARLWKARVGFPDPAGVPYLRDKAAAKAREYGAVLLKAGITSAGRARAEGMGHYAGPDGLPAKAGAAEGQVTP